MNEKSMETQMEVLEVAARIMKLYQDHLPEETFNSVIYGLNRVKMDIQEEYSLLAGE
ncbi:MAG: hypothetical protein WC942_08670 [Clostridia bacterium]|jgi:hypothetical protein